MAFHTGVLRWLAESRRLEEVAHLSTVSGGTLLAGLVLGLNGWSWPGSQQFLDVTRDKIRHVLTTVDIQKAAIRRLALPWNWPYILSRANVLSETITAEWSIKATLADLPPRPMWSVNGTTAETGRRFRFKQGTCGDYELGYAAAADFKVADAMAVSAAFPGGVGPFVIRTRDHQWDKRPSWDGPEPAQRVIPPFRKLHIYDGGIYDNLGMEPLFDVGKRGLKQEVDEVLISDAGAPLEREATRSPFNPFRMKRWIDLALDQTRALRVRVFVETLMAHPSTGSYLQIGAVAEDKIGTHAARNPAGAAALAQSSWLPSEEVRLALWHPTTLRKMAPQEFDRLERHGYETAHWNHVLFYPRADAPGSGAPLPP